MSEYQEVEVEYDDEGRSTDVEREEPEELIHEPFDPAEIDVLTRTPTVDLLLKRLRRGVLDLSPDFQRSAGIWSDVNQSRLIESLLLRIPLPTLYAAESGEETWAVVDGIQRLTTIARFVDPDVIGAKPLKLRGLEYLHQYDGLRYDELPGALQTRIGETELVVHLIRAGTPEPVKFNIFARINTGGRPLTTQELRHALIPGAARVLLKELAASQAFLDATLGSVSPTRMADREMALRFLAFRITPPENYARGDLDSFLRQAMRQINEMTQTEIERLSGEFNKAMRAATDIFGDNAFRKQFVGQERRLPVNKALFETISVNFAALTQKELSILRSRRTDVTERFLGLMELGSFLQSISGGTGDVVKVRRRFSDIQQMLQEVLDD
ncbi:MAG: DUF262 domain-containing protein [Trebonia sp.]